MNIEAGGAVTNSQGVIGSGGNSTGIVTVSGENSLWTNTNLFIGSSGNGTLNIVAGGAVTSSQGVIGSGGNSTGIVTVSGENSLWTSNVGLYAFDIGSSGNGTLNIEAGAAVRSSLVRIGREENSVGIVTVSGENSTWTAGGLDIGVGGNGTLIVEAGGRVSSDQIKLGVNENAAGIITVSGENSSLILKSLYGIYVGQSGSGTLNIEAGGTVVANRTIFIGYGENSTGVVTVSGENSLWTNNGTLIIGRSGNGTLNVEAGGTVTNTSGIIGNTVGSSGVVSVSGIGSSLLNRGSLTVGLNGSGALIIEDDGAVTIGGLGVSGGSAVSGSGTVRINDGTLTIGGAAGDVAVGAGNLNTATLDFGQGNGTVVFNHTNTDYEFGAAMQSVDNGIHVLNHISGVTTLTGGSSAFTGTTNVSGGTLTVANALGGSASVTGGRLVIDGSFGGNVDARTGGAISGVGTINGDADIRDGGILAGSQGQTLRINGSVDMDADSAVNVTLGGASSSALFNVGGNLTLDGTLNVTDQGGFGAGIYRIFDYGGSLNDQGMTFGSLPAGIGADDLFIQTAVSNQVNLVNSSGVTLSFWDGNDAALHDNDTIDGGSGSWRADGRNWTDVGGAVNGAYQPNPTFAIFQGTAGVVTVDTSAGAIGATGMQFAVDGYRVEGDAIALEGAGGISIIRVGDGTVASASAVATIASDLVGNTALVKGDYGTLVLEGNNSYTGGTQLDGGTLSVASDANLGHQDGALTFNGGTLATTGSFVSDRIVNLMSTGRFDVASGTQLQLNGPVAGPNDLIKQGEGTLVLAGSNGYRNTLVAAGTLTGNANAISGHIGNAGTVVFDQASDAGFAGDISGFNGTDGRMVKQGIGTLTLDGVSTLGWTVENGRLATAADRFAGDVQIGADGTFSFGQSKDVTYAGVISGDGTFLYNNQGTVLLTGDSSGFSGTTTINSGTLIVGDSAGDGTLGGNLDVLSGATLAGSGSVGSGIGSLVTIASGGTLSPGNSIGTLTVNGDLVFNTGARFVVEVNPDSTDSDLVKVTGNATLHGGSVAHIGANGNYDLRSVYTILSAQTLAGEFEDVSSDFAFLTPNLLYDYQAGTVDLELIRNERDFASVALTRNQKATAEGIDSIGLEAGHAVYDAIAQLTDNDDLIRSSFDALSGEVHGSVKTALVEDSRFIRNAANDRIRAAFGEAGASSAPVLAYGPDGNPMLAPADRAGIVYWSRGFGSWGSTDSDGNAASIDRDTGGLLIGADTLVDDWRVGALAGYSRSSIDVNDRASSASSDNYHLGLYGGKKWGNIALRTGAAYSWHNIDTSRSVSIPGLSDSLSADYNAGTVQAFGELGYDIHMGNTRFEPFANLAYVHLNTRAFSEDGGAAALSGRSGNTDITFTTLGIRGEHAATLGTINARLRGTVGWRHAFGDTTPESTHFFSAGNAFTIAGVPVARNSAIVEAGLDLQLTPKTTVGLSYTGQLASDAYDHGFNASLKLRF